MKQITCPHCGDTYPDFDVAHVCSQGPYAPRLESKRTTIQLDLEDDLLFQLMLRAHEQDITLNQLVENILREFIKNNPLPNETGSTEE
jgi:hypothetical protein